MAIGAPKEMVQTSIATHNAASPVGVEKLAEGRNRTLNEAATVSKGNSDMTDALEELGMAAATRGKPNLDKMKVRQGARTNFDALGRIADYYDKLPDLPQDQKLRELAKRFEQFEEMLSGGGSGSLSSEDILQALQEFDSDPSHQFAVLENMRADAAAKGASPDYLAALDAARAHFHEPETARDVKAGFAMAGTAHARADALGGTPEQMRESYREMLRDSKHMGQIFDTLRDFNLAMKFEEVVDTFMGVAGDDIGSFGPSTDPAQLHGVVQELSKLKQLTTLHSAMQQ